MRWISGGFKHRSFGVEADGRGVGSLFPLLQPTYRFIQIQMAAGVTPSQ